MKKIIISLAVATTLCAAPAFAALNSYLKIEGAKGSSQVVTCPSGVCVIPTLVADTYTVSVVDAQGAPATESSMSCDVKSPRDAASGMATGKRQHKPMSFTKEVTKASVVFAQDESNLAITCSSSTTPPAAPTAVMGDAAKAAGYDLKKATK